MTPLAVKAVQFSAMLGFGSRVSRTEVDVVRRKGESLNGGTTHCHDVCTAMDQFSVCLASWLLVECT